MCLSACFLDAEVQDGMLMIVNVLLHVVFQELFKKRHKIGANAPWRVDSASASACPTALCRLTSDPSILYHARLA